MSAACLLVAGQMLTLAAGGFTLSWTHSVERTEWRETWSVTPAGLVLDEARVRGSGAGMEPGEGAQLEDGWWVWEPAPAPLPQLVLAASGATGSPWTLCSAGDCRTLGAEAGEPLVVAACEDQPGIPPAR